jgi:hypothetical protein
MCTLLLLLKRCPNNETESKKKKSSYILCLAGSFHCILKSSTSQNLNELVYNPVPRRPVTVP